KFVAAAGLETFDPVRHDVLVWLGCAGSFEAGFQKSLRSPFESPRARAVRFGVLAKRQCTGDPAKRPGSRCLVQELATSTTEALGLLASFGADVREPVRDRENPFCCGAGGGLLLADKEEDPGSRISDVRFKQLQETGASTVVTACPFCSIMLKGAQASAQADT